jgi:fructose-1,6-bisphosphatase I
VTVPTHTHYPLTLSGHLFRRQAMKGSRTGRFSRVFARLDLAARIIAREVNRAGLAGVLGAAGAVNVQGEDVQKLDRIGNQVFLDALSDTGLIAAVASEEMEDVYVYEDAPDGHYVICFDPVDGSSNIDVDVTIGSIWSLLRVLPGVPPGDPRQFLRAGTDILAAGYVVYGPSTMFVYADDISVDGFTLERSIGAFFLTHPDMKIPPGGSTYSVNEANWSKWAPPQQELVARLRHGEGDGPPPAARYVGSLVADVHRTLLKGGLYMYPGEIKKPHGKLRLLYEAAPLAFVVESAGGRATDGTTRILDKVPHRLHERTPLYIGSADQVDAIQRQLA